MADDGDDLVLFQDVRVIHSTAPALLGRVARDRNLLDARGAATDAE
jgi:hypothetical protein